VNLRKAGLVLAIVTLLIAILATQWPFEYRVTWFALRVRSRRVDLSWFPRRPDGGIRIDRDSVLNLLMLIPLGLGFGLWRRCGGLRLLAETLLVGVLSGAALELAQLPTRDRYPSFPDLWHNALGCLAGGALALAVRRRDRTAKRCGAHTR
jgi:glycopeptide antibiotics resistance protein